MIQLQDEWLRLYKHVELSPEKKLFLAVIEDALRIFQDNIDTTNNKRRVIFNQTKFWFRNSSDQWIFSFENVCCVLDIEPDPIRRKLDQIILKQQQPSEVRDGGLLSAAIGRPAQ